MHSVLLQTQKTLQYIVHTFLEKLTLWCAARAIREINCLQYLSDVNNAKINEVETTDIFARHQLQDEVLKQKRINKHFRRQLLNTHFHNTSI
ncbi:hypothetical protein PROFUN_09293 [Planoprotostelium fungivorum]|uniref:Uncharacterized protein n=1 Tax=Planoprotostelium fungivorum TaxID=1890364 RepID=A0A2P6NHA5_9EUKA|nr:hypothetical protein PROFUN_09293 [Planoprotostelium fungivorum]